MTQDLPPVITRFAPSPTGMLHIGGARTALFNWLYARSRGGRFLLRIEDTDKARSTQEAIYAIIKGLAWLGLHHDDNIIYQSDRHARHQDAAQALLDLGQAYHCYCSAEELQAMRAQQRAARVQIRYNGLWRDRDPREAPPGISPTLRLKTPREGQTAIQDSIQGLVTVDHSELDDMILLRSDKTPTYVFSAVVDDHDMDITHVIRGDDHLTNSFRQWQIYRAFGWQPPVFAHQPLIHGPDGAKLSKRHGDVLSIESYRQKGYLPEAMRNYLLRLGWGHGNEEIIEEARAIKLFDLSKIGRSPARYDRFKLDSFNAYYIKAREDDELIELIGPWLEEPLDSIRQARLEQAMVYLKPRARNLVQLANNAKFLITSRPIPIEEKAQNWLQGHGHTLLAEIRHILANLSDWETKTLENALRAHADSGGHKLGALAQPLRAALTGARVSPGIFEIAAILGREESLARIDDVL